MIYANIGWGWSSIMLHNKITSTFVQPVQKLQVERLKLSISTNCTCWANLITAPFVTASQSLSDNLLSEYNNVWWFSIQENYSK